MPANDPATVIILAGPELLWQPFVLVFSGLAVLVAGTFRRRPLPGLAGLVACECGAWLDSDLTLAAGAAVVMLAIWLGRAKDNGKLGQTGKNCWGGDDADQDHHQVKGPKSGADKKMPDQP